MTLVRLAAPEIRVTACRGTPNAPATAARAAAVALPCTARWLTRTTSASPYAPPTPGWADPGRTRTVIRTGPVCPGVRTHRAALRFRRRSEPAGSPHPGHQALAAGRELLVFGAQRLFQLPFLGADAHPQADPAQHGHGQQAPHIVAGQRDPDQDERDPRVGRVADIPVGPAGHHVMPGLDPDLVLEEPAQGGDRPGPQADAGQDQHQAHDERPDLAPGHGSPPRRPRISAAMTEATRDG